MEGWRFQRRIQASSQGLCFRTCMWWSVSKHPGLMRYSSEPSSISDNLVTSLENDNCYNHPLHVCRRIGYFPVANNTEATIMQLERVCHNHPLHVCRRIGYFPIANEPTTCNYKEYAAIMKCCPRITVLLMIAELNNYKRRCKYCNLQEANMNMHDREERTVETHQTVFFIPWPDSRPLRISYSIDPSFPYKHLHRYSNRLMQTQTEHRNLWHSTRITAF